MSKNKPFLFMIILILIILQAGLFRAESYQLLELKNGIKIIHIHNTRSSNTVLKLFIRGGRSLEPAGKSGINYLCSRLILEPRNDSQQKSMNKTGSFFGLYAFEDYTVLDFVSLTRHFPKALKNFCLRLSDPLLSPNRIY
jgi:predicted Zn-dependent peptidase